MSGNHNDRFKDRSGAARISLAGWFVEMPALRAQVNGRLYWQRTLWIAYVCHRSRLDNGEQPCISFAGLSVDDAISREIVSVLEPAATEAAVLASEQETLQQDEIISALKRELEAAQYNARRAEK